MKNQYVGDIVDYGKYGLLRFLMGSGVKIGVNWYLTPNDNRADGKYVEYLDDARMREYDALVYDEMSRLASRQDKTVQMVEKSGILDGALFYNHLLDLETMDWHKRTDARMEWHKEAVTLLKSADMIFADPDNSLTVKKKITQKDGQKYVFPGEIADYYDRGQDIIYYHERSHENETGWMEEKTNMKKYLPEAELLAISSHRWKYCTYIFVLHKEKYDFYKKVINAFLNSAWGTYKVDGKFFFTQEIV